MGGVHLRGRRPRRYEHPPLRVFLAPSLNIEQAFFARLLVGNILILRGNRSVFKIKYWIKLRLLNEVLLSPLNFIMFKKLCQKFSNFA